MSTLVTLGLAAKGAATKTLIVDSLDNANLVLSSRNVRKTKITNSFGLNIYDIVCHEKLVISKSAVEELNNLLDPKRETGIIEPAVPIEEPKAVEKPKAKRTAKPKVEKAEAPAEEKVEVAPVVEGTAPAEVSAAEAATAEESVAAEAASVEDTSSETSEEAAKDE